MKSKLYILVALTPLLIGCGSTTTEDNKNYWPNESITEFLSSKDINNVFIPSLEIKTKSDLEYVNTESKDGYTFLSIGLNADYSSSYKNLLISNNYTLEDGYYLDESQQVAIDVNYETSTIINIFDSSDVILPEIDYWPTNHIDDFLNEKGINNITVPSLEIKTAGVVEFAEKEIDNQIEYFHISINGNYLNTYVSKLNAANYTLEDGYYYDPFKFIAISASYTNKLNIYIYDASDIGNVDPQPEEKTKTVSYNLEDIFGNESAANLTKTTTDGAIFTASKASGTNNPKSDKQGNGYLALYADNTFTLSGLNYREIEFTFNTDKVPDISVDSGVLTKKTNYLYSWKGVSENLIVTALSQSRLQSILITFIDGKDDPIPLELKTVEEVYDIAETIVYPTSLEWYLSNKEVILRGEIVDAIDSTATGGSLDGNARGKMVLLDSTGYIIVSSATEGDCLYQAVKTWLKNGTTKYEITGKIAFFNGVIEVKVSSYKYVASIVVNKNYEAFSRVTYDNANAFINDAIDNIKTNEKGYGINGIVKMTGLTFFNKYNDAGSYYFLDQCSKIVPVYSFLDKDRTSLLKGQVYDIYGLETMYKNRPSLRILKVEKSAQNPVNFNFLSDSTTVSSLDSFYNISVGRTDAYMKSELTVYKAECYVSRYAEDKYTFNTSYVYDSYRKMYTTGYDLTNAVKNKSLGIFNSDLTYNQTLLDFVLENANDKDTADSLRVTLYFTLAQHDLVDGKDYWRVNIFEDLVPSYDYYSSKSTTMVFNTTSTSCNYQDGVYQEWSNSTFTLRNETNDYIISRDPTYLKINDGTALKISSNSLIYGFTFYHSTFSSIYALEGLEFWSYKQYNDHTEFILKEGTKEINISNFLVTGENYIKITSMVVRHA